MRCVGVGSWGEKYSSSLRPALQVNGSSVMACSLGLFQTGGWSSQYLWAALLSLHCRPLSFGLMQPMWSCCLRFPSLLFNALAAFLPFPIKVSGSSPYPGPTSSLDMYHTLMLLFVHVVTSFYSGNIYWAIYPVCARSKGYSDDGGRQTIILNVASRLWGWQTIKQWRWR